MEYRESIQAFKNDKRSHMDRTSFPRSISYNRLYVPNPSDTAPLDPRTLQRLRTLVERFTANNATDLRTSSTESLRAKTERLFEQCARTLASENTPSVLQDENHIANMIRRKLTRDLTDPAKATRFGHLYNKFASQSVSANKWAILYFLHLVSEQNERSNSSAPGPSATDTPLFSSAGLQDISPQLQPAISRPYEGTRDPLRNTRRKLTREKEPLSQQAYTSPSDSSLPPSVQLARARERLRDSSDTSAPDLPESALLRDLIFIFQGIDGRYIKFDPSIDDYTMDCSVNIPQPTKDMVFHLTQLGWQYKKVHSFVQSKFGDPKMGLVGQSFCSVLQRELTDYYKLIAVLEAQIEKQTTHTQNGNDITLPTEQTLTMKRLLVWTKESLERLKLMGTLVDVCQDQKGGTLVSTMHNHTNHGDPFIYRYISGMLQEPVLSAPRQVSKPFYEMLERWIYEGELDDPYEEFFVACDSSVSEEELWQNKYSIREDMLPAFISRELAQKIFSIGKSLNFIRYSCHDDTLVEKYCAPTTNNSTMRKFKYGDIQAVERSIGITYLETSKKLLDLLKGKYKLMEHLRALKRYLLLGQGDFIQHLMDTLGPELSQPANTLYCHNFAGVLDTAIRSSNAQYDDPEILNRLEISLYEDSSDEPGWDIVTLEYRVDSPINTVFSPQAMRQYLQMFSFLWRLKRMEYTLSACWRRWGAASREFATIPEISPDLHQAQLSIGRMVHFIYQLQHYYLFEKPRVLIWIPSLRLTLGISMKLLKKDSSVLATRLNNLFDMIISYSEALDQLYSLSNEEKMIRANTGSITMSIQDLDKLQRIRSRRADLENKFKAELLEFLELLTSYHDDDLRSLSTRLNYNNHYSSASTAM
ncbi:Gamma-tubulin complex component 3 [Apophysomyces ossiformis]|uniref:Gamma-tubulin complex component 3 n=1 Tax=Apophysomyces ossiformis TaxID=679940 RepID=A0A8H7BWA9_9FUNG|nr:Gamma-tubulin complex component 3 [Apophysomyces ossiformis]